MNGGRGQASGGCQVRRKSIGVSAGMATGRECHPRLGEGGRDVPGPERGDFVGDKQRSFLCGNGRDFAATEAELPRSLQRCRVLPGAAAYLPALPRTFGSCRVVSGVAAYFLALLRTRQRCRVVSSAVAYPPALPRSFESCRVLPGAAA